jgi:hypothetical protein
MTSCRISMGSTTPRENWERTMAKLIWKWSDASDPMYKEGYRSYSPHWARKFQPSKTPSPESTAGPPSAEAGSGASQIDEAGGEVGKESRPIKKL